MISNSRIILVTGGARSGKSVLAERIAGQFDMPRIYIATATAGDEEMSRRIARHREMRGTGWLTVEESRDLGRALAATDGQGVRLVDCLTLWLSNSFRDDDFAAETGPLCATLAAQKSPVVLVTNELGLGIVPENSLARRFRDAHGLMNQAVAAASDQVWMSVSGLPLRLKPERESP
jgi:adenosylcobinamide kinase/adenosylcobinamide-phosphate guanylyltransferase